MVSLISLHNNRQGQAMENHYRKANGCILRAPQDSESDESEDGEEEEEEEDELQSTKPNETPPTQKTRLDLLVQRRKMMDLEEEESTEDDDGTITPREYSAAVARSISMPEPLKRTTTTTSSILTSCSTMRMMTKMMNSNTTVPRVPTVDTVTRYGRNADVCSAPVRQQEDASTSANDIVTVAAHSNTQPPAQAHQSTPADTSRQQTPPRSDAGSPNGVGGVGVADRLSPRLEMRLALNNDILGDEDLIGYAPGPDYATILGQDLSAFHRLTGREILSRTGSHRIVPKEAQIISLSQQRNSKIDTPTPNRKKTNLNTWSSSASVVVDVESGGNSWNSAIVHPSATHQPVTASTVEAVAVDMAVGNRKLTDLERLARQEKRYCMSQSRNSPVAARFTNHTKRSVQDDGRISKTSKLYVPSTCSNRHLHPSNHLLVNSFSFLKRRNSENHLASSKDSSDDAPSSNEKLFSPRKETVI